MLAQGEEEGEDEEEDDADDGVDDGAEEDDEFGVVQRRIGLPRFPAPNYRAEFVQSHNPDIADRCVPVHACMRGSIYS